MMRDIEEVVAVQMRDEHLVHRGVADVLAGDAFHRDAETGGQEPVVAQCDLAVGEAHGAAVMIKEIAPGPANEALFRVRKQGAAERRRGWQRAFAFEWQTGGTPCIETAVESRHVRETGRGELFGSHFGIERAAACAIHDDGAGLVGSESGDLIKEGHFISTSLL